MMLKEVLNGAWLGFCSLNTFRVLVPGVCYCDSLAVSNVTSTMMIHRSSFENSEKFSFYDLNRRPMNWFIALFLVLERKGIQWYRKLYLLGKFCLCCELVWISRRFVTFQWQITFDMSFIVVGQISKWYLLQNIYHQWNQWKYNSIE